MLMLSYALATLFYGRPTLTELNFIKVFIFLFSTILFKNGHNFMERRIFCSTLEFLYPLFWTSL